MAELTHVSYNNSSKTKPRCNIYSRYRCVGFNTQFTDSSTITTPLGGTITTWQWNFGDGIGTSTDQNPSYGYQNFGTFNVQLIITDQYGCMDSVTIPIDVNPGPIAAFTHDTICEGTPTTFQDLTTTVPPPLVEH